MAPDRVSGWTFLSNHALVLLAIGRNPNVRIRKLAHLIRITERAAQRIVTELADAGFIERERRGRRNHYRLVEGAAIQHPLGEALTVADLMRLLEVKPQVASSPMRPQAHRNAASEAE